MTGSEQGHSQGASGRHGLTHHALSHHGRTHQGLVRARNEDNWTALPGFLPDMELYIVSDGIGGAARGDLASRVVVESLPLILSGVISKDTTGDLEQCARDAIAELSDMLRSQVKENPSLHDMGATVACLMVGADRAVVAHMGDSRVYRYNEDGLEQLTTDHTIIQLLLENGEITGQEAKTHPARGRLTRSVGMPGEPLPDAAGIELAEGDILLLCSDGLSGMVSDGHIAAILALSRPLEEMGESLVQAALDGGGKDNVTVLLVKVEKYAHSG